MRGANPRVHKLLYHLYVVEKNGGNVERALERALLPGIKGEFYYSQSLVKQRTMLNYRAAKDLGLFDNGSNLEAMRRGIAPIIQRGPHAGDIVHVDHIIPLKHAPELGNNLANLRYLPESENLSRSASLDKDALTLSEQMRKAGWHPSSQIAELATP